MPELTKVDVKTRYIRGEDFVSAFKDYREKRPATIFNRHEGYEIILILSGWCDYRVEDRTYRLNKGDLIFIAEGEYHTLDVPEKCDTMFVDFRPARLFAQPEMLEIFLRPFHRGLSGGKHRESGNTLLFNQVRRVITLALEKKDPIAITGEILKMLRLFEGMKTAADPGISAGRMKLRPALSLIYERYTESLTVPDMAVACAMSRSSFYNLFRRTLKKEPKAFLNSLRLDQAVTLLSTTPKKISDIALSTGFPNLSFFNRMFRARMGVSPREFRRARLRTGAPAGFSPRQRP